MVLVVAAWERSLLLGLCPLDVLHAASTTDRVARINSNVIRPEEHPENHLKDSLDDRFWLVISVIPPLGAYFDTAYHRLICILDS